MLLQAMMTWNSRNAIDNAHASWDLDLEVSLAQAYLFNVPNHTSFQFWGNGWWYGSGNTDDSYNFWARCGAFLHLCAV